VGSEHEQAAFEFLVVGDSLVWGQGLEEDQKFYRLTKAWLRDDVFGGERTVHLNVRAHSGSTILLDEVEAKALARADREKIGSIHPEINVSFPTIRKQLDAARHDYADPDKVDLVMLSGGVPEVGVSNILNPFQSDDKLRADIKLYCHDHMSSLLGETAKTFPGALIAVIGYYPIITRHTPVKRIVNDILELYNWPGWTKPLMNNPLNRVLWRRYRRKMIERSTIWLDDSTAELQNAVNELNAKTGRVTAVLIKPPFKNENGYGAKETYLWKVAKNGKAGDPMRLKRKEECRPTLDTLREETKLKYRTRVCELASIGHPNAAGAAAIAAQIRENLMPFLAEKFPTIS
jgi:hypothetical protein